jgi:hypothetical protein
MRGGRKTLVKIIGSAKNEYGIAMPLVLALMVIMTLLAITAMNVAAGNTNIVSRFLLNEKSLYAAEKGYNQYLWKLNNDDDFYTDTSSYDCDTTSESGYYIYTPKDTSGDESNSFRVQMRVPLISTGSASLEPARNEVIIRSTGWDGNNTENKRTIEVELLRRTFTQHAMISDQEQASDGDNVIWYAGDTVYGSIHTNDTFYLDNSILNRGNATFWDLVTYGNRIVVTGLSIFESDESVRNNPDIFKKGTMKLERAIKFPGNKELNELRVLAKMDGAYYNGRTCIYLNGDSYNVRYYDRTTNSWYYNGQKYRMIAYPVPPFSLINTSANNERARILTEWLNEKSTTRVLYETLDDNNEVVQQYNSFADMAATCGSLSFPENRVIYVEGLTGSGTHPYDSSIAAKFQPTMGNVFVSGQLEGRLTIASANDIYITGHDPCDWRHPTLISGFNDDPGVTYADTDYDQIWNADNSEWLGTEVEGEDMLGLIAKRNIHTIHWNWPSQISYEVAAVFSPNQDRFSYNWGRKPITLSLLDYNNLITYDTAPNDISIHGALFAVDGSFGLETNWVGLGNLGSTLKGLISGFPGLGSMVAKDNMKVFGSIGQHLREHTNKPPRFDDFDLDFDWVAGYTTEYTHDPRMLNDMPPSFLSPSNSGWYSNHWEEVNTHID